MNARIFLHPRTWTGPAQGAVTASLEAAGYTDERLRIGPLGKHHRRELVLEIEQVGAYTMYERMDGSRFRHRMGQPAPEPTEVA